MRRAIMLAPIVAAGLAGMSLPASASAPECPERPPVSAGTVFAPHMEDVPLAATACVSHTVVFDTPQGRIVEVTSNALLEPAEAAVYYTENLPRLGWTRVDETTGLVFHRGMERLRIQLSAAGKSGAVIRLKLDPKPSL